ncbi:tectonin domain-containing protein [Collimonas fungivorans]|uniref:tectonin domain-containing protein n=1 Tax=Collimonas fungivorans TaxID=158899 RepID=UPI003FA37800
MTSINTNKLIPHLIRKMLTITLASIAFFFGVPLTTHATSTAAPTICQAQSGASWCSNQAPGPVNNGYHSLTWTNLNKNFVEITVANDVVWGIDSNTDLWQLPDFKSGIVWTKVAHGVKKIVSNGNLLCQINADNYIYCSTSLTPPSTADANGYHSISWLKTKINTMSTIALGVGNKIWGIDSNQNLYLYNDYSNPVPANTYKVAANVYEIATDGSVLCQKNVSRSVSESYCSNSLVPSATKDSNGYNSLSWTDLGTSYSSLAVTGGQVWGVSPTSPFDVWYMPDYTNKSSWYKIASGGVKVAVASAPSTVSVINPFASDEVPILIFMGQSNSAGMNAIPSSFTLTNAPNVWGITNVGWNYMAGNGNGTTPAFTSAISTISSVSWSHWTDSSSGNDMNLGFNNKGSGNAADFAAYQWQSLINAGNKLPDLHIIHIGWPSQGIDPLDYYDPNAANWVKHGVNLWQPGLDTSKQPSYALAPFARRILYLALRDIMNSGKVPRIIGMQWNQWEAEADNTTAASKKSATTVANAPGNYATLFKGFYDAVGAHFPIQIVKPLSTAAVFNGYTPTMQKVFSDLMAAAPSDYSIIDASTTVVSPNSIYTGGSLGGGDGSVHYNLDTHKWFAAQAINTCLVNGKCGTRILSTILPGTAPN